MLNFEDLKNLKLAHDLAKTCFEMYSVSSIGLTPKIACFHTELLLAVISTYRYNGDEFDESKTHSKANIRSQTIENKGFNDDEIIRILSTRSKKQLCVTFNACRNI